LSLGSGLSSSTASAAVVAVGYGAPHSFIGVRFGARRTQVGVQDFQRGLSGVVRARESTERRPKIHVRCLILGPCHRSSFSASKHTKLIENYFSLT